MNMEHCGLFQTTGFAREVLSAILANVPRRQAKKANFIFLFFPVNHRTPKGVSSTKQTNLPDLWNILPLQNTKYIADATTARTGIDVTGGSGMQITVMPTSLSGEQNSLMLCVRNMNMSIVWQCFNFKPWNRMLQCLGVSGLGINAAGSAFKFVSLYFLWLTYKFMVLVCM